MYKHIISKRSKLKNFAPKILLCAQLIVLSIRNANIVILILLQRSPIDLPSLCFDAF